MILSGHAKEEMETSGITEVRACLEHGELEIKQMVRGEMRYGNMLELKDNLAIYTYQSGKKRVITCYPVKRKRWERK